MFSESSIHLDQGYAKRAFTFDRVMQQRYQENSSADLIIYPATILHAVTKSGIERDQKYFALFNNTDIIARETTNELKMMKKLFTESIKTWIQLNTTVLVLEAEPISPNKFAFDAERNLNIERMNKFLRVLIPDSGMSNGKVFRMGVNLKTVVDKLTGEHMFTKDRYNLVRTDALTPVSPAFLADVNVMFNFLCNFKFAENETDCCYEKPKFTK